MLEFNRIARRARAAQRDQMDRTLLRFPLKFQTPHAGVGIRYPARERMCVRVYARERVCMYVDIQGDSSETRERETASR